MKCLKCHGDNVHVHTRGYNLISGFIGSSKLMITCLDCGYKTKVTEKKAKDTKFLNKSIKLFLILLIFCSIIIIAKLMGLIV